MMLSMAFRVSLVLAVIVGGILTASLTRAETPAGSNVDTRVIVSLHHKAPMGIVDHYAIAIDGFDKDSVTRARVWGRRRPTRASADLLRHSSRFVLHCGPLADMLPAGATQ